MIKRIVAIAFIFICTCAAWFILGATVNYRTYNQDSSNKTQIDQLWGSFHDQRAPHFHYQTTEKKNVDREQNGKVVSLVETVIINNPVPLETSDIKVNLKLKHRQKGLMWYATYKVHFDGHYTVLNDSAEPRKLFLEFPFPASQAVYDNLKLVLNGHPVTNMSSANSVGLQDSLMLKPGETGDIQVSYDSQGVDTWHYSFSDGVNQIKNFKLTMNTDFKDIDFPNGSLSPTDKVETPEGWDLTWKYNNMMTGFKIGMALPKLLNPGPWVSEVTFFAPVSLFMFFFLLFMFTTLKKVNVHPMNYFFIGAAFFSFHLLMAYLVDHMSIHWAFLIASVVSIFLVVSYMRIVTPGKFAYLEVGLSQFIYLVLFSYTFFFERFTGLVITIMSIITLFVVMQMTARVNWSELFQNQQNSQPPQIRRPKRVE